MGSSSAWRSRISEGRAGAEPATLVTTAGLAFLAFLNATVLNVALPDVASALDAGIGDASWTVTAYGAALAAGLIAGGRLADAVGRRRTLSAGAFAFVVASLACALAPTADALIAARVVQGAAAALVTPASFGLLLETTGKEGRPRAIGLWSAAAATSAFIGPPVGGLMADLAGWRAPFVLGTLVAAVLGVLAVKLPVSGERRRQMPAMPGVSVGAAAVAMLVVATAQGGEWGWADARTIVGLVGGAAGVGIGVMGSDKGGWRLVDPGLLGRRVFAAANVLSVAFALAAFAWLLAAPLFVATVWGWGAQSAALSVAPGAVAAAAAAWAAGRLPRRGRPWAVVAGGVVLTVTALGLAEALGRSPEFLSVWLPAGIAAGIALGAVLASLSAIVADSVPSRDFAQGAGINMTARQLGGALGIALVAALVGTHGGSSPSDFIPLWLLIAAASAVTAIGATVLLRRQVMRDRRRKRELGRYASVRLET
jgi:MFS family permease